jgi:hypothetical protein
LSCGIVVLAIAMGGLRAVAGSPKRADAIES